MSRIHTDTCQFCGRHGDVVVVEYPFNTLFWRCAKGCPPPPDDGLCHAYRDHPGMDCLQPAGHDGDHGDPEPRGH